ncbi:MAG: hypothetical protein R3D62_07110 [Xanthobacteraceae bacterium]
MRETTTPSTGENDVRVVEIDECGVEHGLALLDRCLVEFDLRLRLLVVALGGIHRIL